MKINEYIQIKKKVVVIQGKDKGKTGNVIRVYRKSNKVLVSGINMVSLKKFKIKGKISKSYKKRK